MIMACAVKQYLSNTVSSAQINEYILYNNFMKIKF